MKNNITPPIPKNGSGWNKIIIWLLTTLASVSVAYGVLSTKIESLEKDVSYLRDIHSEIAILKTMMDDVKSDVQEVKSDIKDIRAKAYSE